MRLVTAVLIVLLVSIQYPLWWGHGGWLRVKDLKQQLAQQEQKNTNAKLRNKRLAGDVQGLQSGTAASEEQARYEAGMLKDGEVFVQFTSPTEPLPSGDTSAATMSTRGEVLAIPARVVPNPQSRFKLGHKHGLGLSP